MISLKDRNWQQIKVADWFNIRSTSTGIDKIRLNTKGDEIIPYVTRTDKNNGMDSYIPMQDISPDDGGVITIGLDTQTCFFQPMTFYTGQNIQIIESDFLNFALAMFLIPSFKTMLAKFNWGGNGATLSRLKRSSIMLPVDSSGKPDWQFMEDYIKEREQLLINQYRDYIQREIDALEKSLRGGGIINSES